MEISDNTKAKPRIGVVSGRYPESSFSSHINHKAYCLRHGYCYINANWPTGEKNPYMNKIRYIQEYYHLFDYLFWIDDDAFFINKEVALESLIPEHGEILVACRSPSYKKIHTYLSSGQFLIKCNNLGRSFIDEVGSTDLEMVKSWWDSTPLDLGFFTNGDQDAMVFQILTNDQYKDRVKLHDHRVFNSRFEELMGKETPFILHFTGSKVVKAKNYVKAQRLREQGPELLDDEELANLFVSQKKSVLIRIKNMINGFKGV